MSLKIKKASDITHDAATYLIYAQPGMGKTTAIKFLKGKTLIIDVDKSSSVLKGEPNIDIVEIDTHNIWQAWLDTVKELITGDYSQYDNIVIDNVSELFRATLANLGRDGKNHRVPEQSHYQRVDFTILDSLRALKRLDARIIFTAWETSDVWQTESGQSFNRSYPDIRSKILNNFMGLCDVVARLVVTVDEEGKQKRGFILQPTNSVYAKNRLENQLEKLLELFIEDVFSQAVMEKKRLEINTKIDAVNEKIYKLEIGSRDAAKREALDTLGSMSKSIFDLDPKSQKRIVNQLIESIHVTKEALTIKWVFD